MTRLTTLYVFHKTYIFTIRSDRGQHFLDCSLDQDFSHQSIRASFRIQRFESFFHKLVFIPVDFELGNLGHELLALGEHLLVLNGRLLLLCRHDVANEESIRNRVRKIRMQGTICTSLGCFEVKRDNRLDE
jgi:hypothetical protein